MSRELRRYESKTAPRGKQADVIAKWEQPLRAWLCRPGTGKSKIGIDTAGHLFCADLIDAFIVVAPDGVQTQWVAEQIPKHLGDDVSWVGGDYRSKMGIRAHKALEQYLQARGPSLKVLAISFEGLATPRGRKLAMRLVQAYRCLVVIDESHRVSNEKNAGYKHVRELMAYALYKRIATGTLLRQNPFAAYGQTELLRKGVLGFASKTAFKAMYTEMLGKNHHLVKHIAEQFKKKTGKDMTPQVQAKDADGKPIYRNLPDLRKRLEKIADFLTLADVSGKEPIVNVSTRYTELSPEQSRIYKELQDYGIAMLDEEKDKVLIADGALALATRLAQVVGGFVPNEDNPLAEPIDTEVNPRIRDLLAQVEEWDGEKVVIWARFKPELRAIATALRDTFGETVAGVVAEYHGDVDAKQRRENKQRFIEDPNCRFFVGQQQAGGTGLDGLQGVAHMMIFYSNVYAYLDREQCIARLARTNGADVVNVVDLMADGTVDEDIVRCMQAAQDVTEKVLLKAVGVNRG